MAITVKAIIEGLDLADDEALARVIIEGIEIIAKRGRSAWQVLFEGLDSVEEKDEIQIYFGEWAACAEPDEEESDEG